ncbi:MAG: hypothetical protein ACI90V_007709, partial [Bacillariaceae sp.]|jgi:hypothetical protein
VLKFSSVVVMGKCYEKDQDSGFEELDIVYFDVFDNINGKIDESYFENSELDERIVTSLFVSILYSGRLLYVSGVIMLGVVG